MPEGSLPVQVDVFQLQQAEQWLKDTKAYVDNYILTELRKIPGYVCNAPTNPDDQTATLTQSGAMTPAPTSGTVTGLIPSVGATHFGIFPSGRDVANRHASCYNNVLIGLDGVSKDLEKAIAATAYIIANYKDVEEVTAADMTRLMTDTPYQPGAQPETDPGPDTTTPGGSRSYFV